MNKKRKIYPGDLLIDTVGEPSFFMPIVRTKLCISLYVGTLHWEFIVVTVDNYGIEVCPDYAVTTLSSNNEPGVFLMPDESIHSHEQCT